MKPVTDDPAQNAALSTRPLLSVSTTAQHQDDERALASRSFLVDSMSDDQTLERLREKAIHSLRQTGKVFRGRKELR
jgi:hypothetical protein